jgi:hypothetical protein
MTKAERLKVYNKYNGHCAYCGKKIEYKDMQVDHIIPQRAHSLYKQEIDINDIKNMNPSCRRCNHYKRAAMLEEFRRMMKTLHERIRQDYICKVAEDYGIIKIEPWDGKFYFERVDADYEEAVRKVLPWVEVENE